MYSTRTMALPVLVVFLMSISMSLRTRREIHAICVT